MRLLKRRIEQVYNEYSSKLYTSALAVTRSPEMAEDAIHEAFCRALRLTEIPRNLKAYMFKSVRNASIDQLRKRTDAVVLPEDFIFDTSMNPAKIAEANQFSHKVAQVLLGLSEDERETIVLHLYSDLTFREIADLRERSMGTIASWYRRGIGKMKEFLEQSNG